MIVTLRLELDGLRERAGFYLGGRRIRLGPRGHRGGLNRKSLGSGRSVSSKLRPASHTHRMAAKFRRLVTRTQGWVSHESLTHCFYVAGGRI